MPLCLKNEGLHLLREGRDGMLLSSSTHNPAEGFRPWNLSTNSFASYYRLVN